MNLKRFSNCKNRLIYLLVILGFIISSSTGYSVLATGHETAPIRQVRTFEADEQVVQNPAGLAFSSAANAFYVFEKSDLLVEGEVVQLTPFADKISSSQIAVTIENPINTVF